MVTNEDITRTTEKEKLFGDDWAMGEDTARLINALRNEGLLHYSASSPSLDGDKGISLYFYHNLPHNAGIELGNLWLPNNPADLASMLNEYEEKAQNIINFLNKIPNE